MHLRKPSVIYEFMRSLHLCISIYNSVSLFCLTTSLSLWKLIVTLQCMCEDVVGVARVKRWFAKFVHRDYDIEDSRAPDVLVCEIRRPAAVERWLQELGYRNILG